MLLLNGNIGEQYRPKSDERCGVLSGYSFFLLFFARFQLGSLWDKGKECRLKSDPHNVVTDQNLHFFLLGSFLWDIGKEHTLKSDPHNVVTDQDLHFCC